MIAYSLNAKGMINLTSSDAAFSILVKEFFLWVLKVLWSEEFWQLL